MLRVARLMFGFLGIIFIAWAAWKGFEHAYALPRPRMDRLGVSLAISLLSFMTAALGWAKLVSPRQKTLPLMNAYLASQIGKYIPGYFWQAAGQISLTRVTGIPIAKGGPLYAFHVLIQLAAAGAVGTLLYSQLDPVGRAIWAMVTLAAHLAVFWPRVVRPLRILVARIWKDTLRHAPPSPRDALISYLCSLGAMTLVGLGFAVLMGATNAKSIFSAVGAYSLAWGIGFMSILFPAGVGIREASLVLLLPMSMSPAAILASGAYFRLITIVGDFILAAVAWRMNKGTD